ncbi:sensor domain-containing diguanylate cyclase [Deinococcus apachensis]|uniref:sensor domain-containing diguanylate cyclase n=1 Tax=Deinococcus apachensis TaxID=309886 RepID=UPI00036BBDFC|nr:sensor domain-containing diguanylate cyclase [Deinococcus apachensis]
MTALPVAAPADLGEEMLWEVLAAADIGLLVTDAQRRILYVNPTFTRETGYTAQEVLGRSCTFLQGPETDAADIAAIRAALNRGEPVSRVVLNYRKDGSTMRYRLRIRPIRQGGAVRYFVGVQEDYSAAHAAQAQLERLAYLDSLTGLGNRRAFDARLAEAASCGEGFALVLLDLNDFKQVNDGRGHPAGDALLIQVGDCLQRILPEDGSAFRLGGDEFAVLLPGGAEQAGQAQRVLAALEELEGGKLRTGLGCAHFPAEAGDIPSLLRLADRRLYQHKAAVKARR